MFSNECHLFVLMTFYIRQERRNEPCSKLLRVKKVALDYQLRDFRGLFKDLKTFSS